jgi:ABC-type oligopeptide transport system ATPase subunit
MAYDNSKTSPTTPVQDRMVRAVDDIAFNLKRGEFLAIQRVDS